MKISFLGGRLSAILIISMFFLMSCGLIGGYPEVSAPVPDTGGAGALPSPTMTPFLPLEETPTLEIFPEIVEQTSPIPAPMKQVVETSVVPTTVPIPEFYDPAGCRKPGDDYTKVQINGWTLNKRTLEMLQYADSLYWGKLDISNKAITQGSYYDNGTVSFGTHLGGGAVDISVFYPGTYKVAINDVDAIITALRVAGFAAWYREKDELYDGSAIHIHAIAIGDQELTQEAHQQLTGTSGYFWGYSGIPVESGSATIDRHGGPIVCQWMLDLADYGLDLKRIKSRFEPPIEDWRERLRRNAEAYLTTSSDQTLQVAKEMNFVKGGSESPTNMCGPLAASILHDSGLLPGGMSPASDISHFWLANARKDNMPWAMFPLEAYDLFSFTTSTEKFDFVRWPLMPGDFVYTFAGTTGFDHMFVVTEVDVQGRAYTVTNNIQEDGSYLIQRLLLYDPADPGAGAFLNEWSQRPMLGRTGQGGFQVLRNKGLGLASGKRFIYAVQPGDTLPYLAARYYSTVSDIISASYLINLQTLALDRTLVIPVNILFTAE